jgi:hypothetical protein
MPRTFYQLEIVPIQQRMAEVNDWLGAAAVTFQIPDVASPATPGACLTQPKASLSTQDPAHPEVSAEVRSEAGKGRANALSDDHTSSRPEPALPGPSRLPDRRWNI